MRFRLWLLTLCLLLAAAAALYTLNSIAPLGLTDGGRGSDGYLLSEENTQERERYSP